MAELQVLTDKIRRTAEEKAANILAQAKSEYDNILAETRIEGEKDKLSIIEEARKEAERITTRAISASAQKSAQKKLGFKMERIHEVIELSMQSFLKLDDKAYMESLERLLESKAQKNVKGELMLNKKDKQRISKAFSEKLNEYGLSLSEKDADIEGGFILVYGKIEENCAVEAIFREHYEELVDFIGENLF